METKDIIEKLNTPVGMQQMSKELAKLEYQKNTLETDIANNIATLKNTPLPPELSTILEKINNYNNLSDDELQQILNQIDNLEKQAYQELEKIIASDRELFETIINQI